MIVFFVLSYKLPDQVARLVHRIESDPRSFVLIHHDPSTAIPLGLESASQRHVLADPIPIRWGDHTLVTAMLKGIDWVARSRLDPDWVLFLSGQDYPITPLDHVHAELGAAAADTDAFVRYETLTDRREDNTTAWQRACWTRYYRRWITVMDHTVTVPRRHPFRDGLHCQVGSCWMNLGRAAWTGLTGHPRRRSLERYYRSTVLPDESLIHTLLLDVDGLRITRTDRRFLRWPSPGDAHPDLLTTADVRPAVSSDALFARKFDESIHPGVLDAVDAAVDSHEDA